MVNSNRYFLKLCSKVEQSKKSKKNFLFETINDFVGEFDKKIIF